MNFLAFANQSRFKFCILLTYAHESFNIFALSRIS